MSEPSVELDLTGLSQSNYRRHSYRRYSALAGGIVAVIGFSVLAYLVLAFAGSHPAEAQPAYVLVAVSALFAYLCFGLGWWLYRAWARPPVALRVLPNEVEFLFPSGRTQMIEWTRLRGRLDIIVRTTDKRTPPDAKVWLIASTNERPWMVIWAPVIPDTFIPEGAVTAILEAARKAGMWVSEETYLPAFSFDNSRSWTLFRVSPA